MQAEAQTAQHSDPMGPPTPAPSAPSPPTFPAEAPALPGKRRLRIGEVSGPALSMIGTSGRVAPRRSDLAATLRGLTIATVLLVFCSALALLIVADAFATPPGALA